jgi:hypothetical protein
MKWQKKLTKKELKHLQEVHVTTLRAFVQLRKDQNAQVWKDPCFDCRHIAIKLGIEGYQES